ncbi:transposase [Motiliproteus sp. SC1-56]|uniref:REP-associated tyrosine transposase n=1 Tax=Motiliproteus sp. SC1-56 TaxID=2799565 RepID=UPI001A8C65B0|nr:transposase [Motiliproteus sp. SC1-56]
MSRPLRIEFSGALYHVTASGKCRDAIYFGDDDRAQFIGLLAEVCAGYNWRLHAYCLMTNHYHLLVETPDGNLSKGMRQFNGIYTQWINRTHRRVGHLFQGRFKAILVEKESYLLELARYIVLNPVRAGMVPVAQEWPWSSYAATAGLAEEPSWLTTGVVLGRLARSRRTAQERYTHFVAEGVNQASPWDGLRGQIFLGSEQFVEQMQGQLSPHAFLDDVPHVQRRLPPQPLAVYLQLAGDRDTAIYRAYRSGGYSLKEIGDHFGLHYSRVSRIVKKIKGAKDQT